MTWRVDAAAGTLAAVGARVAPGRVCGHTGPGGRRAAQRADRVRPGVSPGRRGAPQLQGGATPGRPKRNHFPFTQIPDASFPKFSLLCSDYAQFCPTLPTIF
jgi:hypothetical protein